MEQTIRRALVLIGWNALLLVTILTLIALAGEASRRATVPFAFKSAPRIFVPDVGWLRRPHSEIYWTNQVDYWNISRANSLGFLDREPLPDRAAESCHITMIGDSFVEAREVPIADKFHVRLEDIAARELPYLDVTTSAFSQGGVGQMEQLAYYDKYSRHLHPKLIVLVAVPNDFVDNFPLWESIRVGLDPDYLPHVSAARTEDGGFKLRQPDPKLRSFRMLQTTEPSEMAQWIEKTFSASWFLEYLTTIFDLRFPQYNENRAHADRLQRIEILSRRSAYAPLLDGWRPVSFGDVRMRSNDEDTPSYFALFAQNNGPPFYIEALAFTSFALDEFKKRADRDGATLVILATHRMSYFGGSTLSRLIDIAADRDIPIIDQGGFIRRQGGVLDDAHWPHDAHWNPAGHQWAAEALLEYLKRNQDICGNRAHNRP